MPSEDRACAYVSACPEFCGRVRPAASSSGRARGRFRGFRRGAAAARAGPRDTAARARLPRIVGYASHGVQQCEQRSSMTSSRSSRRRSLSHSARRSNPLSRRLPTFSPQIEQAIQVPVGVDEARRGERRARQRRLAGLVVLADERLVAILEELHRMQRASRSSSDDPRSRAGSRRGAARPDSRRCRSSAPTRGRRSGAAPSGGSRESPRGWRRSSRRPASAFFAISVMPITVWKFERLMPRRRRNVSMRLVPAAGQAAHLLVQRLRAVDADRDHQPADAARQRPLDERHRLVAEPAGGRENSAGTAIGSSSESPRRDRRDRGA